MSSAENDGFGEADALTLTPRGKGFLMAFPAYEVLNSGI